MRDGVIIVFYDLPCKEALQRREYRKARRQIKALGYLQLQESVYYKYIRNVSMYGYHIGTLKKLFPKEGTVFSICMSFNMFKSMDAICGKLPDIDSLRDTVIVI